jgi:serine/threonine-protein kinase
VRLVRPELPEGLDAVLGRALAKKPADRFASALEFRRALDTLMPTVPVRLDDWLESLVGAEAIAKASDLQALVGGAAATPPRVPTVTQPATADRPMVVATPHTDPAVEAPPVPSAPARPSQEPVSAAPRSSATYAGLLGLAVAGAVGAFALLDWALPHKPDTSGERAAAGTVAAAADIPAPAAVAPEPVPPSAPSAAKPPEPEPATEAKPPLPTGESKPVGSAAEHDDAAPQTPKPGRVHPPAHPKKPAAPAQPSPPAEAENPLTL